MWPDWLPLYRDGKPPCYITVRYSLLVVYSGNFKRKRNQWLMFHSIYQVYIGLLAEMFFFVAVNILSWFN